MDIMELVKQGKGVSKGELEGVTLEDLGRAVYAMGHQLKEDRAGSKTIEETQGEFTARLSDIDKMIEKLRTDLVPNTPLTDHQSESAIRKGGLFSKGVDGKPCLKAREVLEMPVSSALLRGSDAERVKDIKDAYDATVIRMWQEVKRVGDMKTAQENVTKLPDFQRLQRALEAAGYAKTLIHPASGGIAADLTWTMLSSEVLDLVRLRLRVASEAVPVPLVHNLQAFPANRGDAIGVRGGAAVGDPPPRTDITSVIPGAAMFSSVAFGLVNFQVQHVLGFLWWSDDAVTDTSIAMVPYLRDQVAFAISRAVDRACMSGDIQGQTQGNHFDDHAAAFTVQDARTLWNGLRRIGTNYTTSLAAVYTADDFRDQRKRLGIYGLNPDTLRCWMAAQTMYDLMEDPDVLTIDKFGPQATVKTGVLAMIDGVQLIPSEWVPTDTTNGVSEAAGTKGLCIMADMSRFMLGQLGGLNVESTRHAPMLTTIVQAGARYDFKPIEPVDGSGIFAVGGVSPVQITSNVTV